MNGSPNEFLSVLVYVYVCMLVELLMLPFVSACVCMCVCVCVHMKVVVRQHHFCPFMKSKLWLNYFSNNCCLPLLLALC